MDYEASPLALGRLCKSDSPYCLSEQLAKKLSLTYECKYETKNSKVLLKKAKRYKNHYK